ncbi:cobalamin biosynthesis protein, partial [Halorubrum sp. CBA1125]|uniref:cobalamin biosynthesis protein n=1 Tax=Halorubrum sp. CBA1125 TaxID=2668072 RepID=UPI002AA2A316
DGSVTERSVTVETTDEDAARRLAAIAGGGTVDHRIAERDFAHDAAVTRREDAYTVQVIDPSLAANASAALGLPVDGDPGGYRFDSLRDHRRQLLRGLLESCGVVCFRESAGAVGISFVHDDERLLERVRGLLDAEGFAADEPTAASSGGYWFGVADADTAAFAEWVYAGAERPGCSRRTAGRRRSGASSAPRGWRWERSSTVRTGPAGDGDADSQGDGGDQQRGEADP